MLARKPIELLALVVNEEVMLFIIKHPPHGTGQAQEIQDMLLASGSLAIKTTLLFIHEGVLQLLKNQSPKAAHRKPIANAWDALDLYDITEIYVCVDSMKGYGLIAQDLCIAAKPVNKVEIRQLLLQQEIIL